MCVSHRHQAQQNHNKINLSIDGNLTVINYYYYVEYVCVYAAHAATLQQRCQQQT